MDKADTGLAQTRQVELGAAPAKRVERDHLAVLGLLPERNSDVCADEAGATSN